MKEKVVCYLRAASRAQLDHVEKVAAYIRIDAGGDNELGRRTQAYRLEAYAAKHGLQIVEYYEDIGVSGRARIAERPALQRMLKDAQERKFDRIIFTQFDRFFRSVTEYKNCMEQIAPVTWTATEETYDIASESGREFFKYQLHLLENEENMQRERNKTLIAFLDQNKRERQKRKAAKKNPID